MKIMFVITSLKKGGAERVISNLANYLSKDDEVVVLTQFPADVYYEFDKRVKILIPEFSKKYKIPFIRNICQYVFTKKQIVKQKPDIIVTFMKTPSFITIMANKRRIPIITSIRNDPNEEYKGWLNKKLMKKLYKKVDGFVFQTSGAQQFFSKDIQAKSVIIPNPINEKFIREPYDGIRNKEIVSVGRLVNQKNQKLLIESFLDFNKEYKDYKLVIYGEGPLLDDLKLISNNNVEFRGVVNNLEDLIYKSAMFVLSSNYEGMPNSLMEAMALGLPVISTDCPSGGPNFLISNNKNGILVSVNNKDELVSAMKKVVSDEVFAKKIGDNASKISKELSSEVVCTKWKEYIYQIRKKL